MKIVLKHGIIAAVVITAMSGCSPEPEAYVNNVSSVDECVQGNLGTDSECKAQWDMAKDENARTGPRFEDSADCATEFGECERYTIQHDNGTQSSVFIPMLAGMMVGNMMSGSTTGYVPTQPLYRREEDRRNGSSGFVTASGATVSKGTTSVRPSSVRASGPTTISRGGFGGFSGKAGGGFSSGG